MFTSELLELWKYLIRNWNQVFINVVDVYFQILNIGCRCITLADFWLCRCISFCDFRSIVLMLFIVVGAGSFHPYQLSNGNDYLLKLSMKVLTIKHL